MQAQLRHTNPGASPCPRRAFCKPALQFDLRK
jgi:hypothetical protein